MTFDARLLTNEFADGQDAGTDRRSLSSLAPFMAALSCIIWCLNGELLQALQTLPPEVGQVSPMLNLTICHIGMVFVAPLFLWGRAAPAPFGDCEASRAATGLAAYPRSTALLFALILIGFNYCWLSSAWYLPVGFTNAIYQISMAFIYIASIGLFSEAVTLPKFLGVVLAVVGSMFVGSVSWDLASVPVGVALAVLAALGVTVYQVWFRYIFANFKEDVNFLACFGYWVGIWHVLVILPGVFLLDAFGVEHLEVPKGAIAIGGIAVSALLASTFNFLTLCIALCGSPMLLPCVNAVSVPLAMAMDVLLHQTWPTKHALVGGMMIVVSVVLIMDMHLLIFQTGFAREDFATKVKSSSKLSP